MPIAAACNFNHGPCTLLIYSRVLIIHFSSAFIRYQSVEPHHSSFIMSSRKTRLRSDEYNKNINRRGHVELKSKESKHKDNAPSISPFLIGFFFFVLIGSSIFQVSTITLSPFPCRLSDHLLSSASHLHCTTYTQQTY